VWRSVLLNLLVHSVTSRLKKIKMYDGGVRGAGEWRRGREGEGVDQKINCICYSRVPQFWTANQQWSLSTGSRSKQANELTNTQLTPYSNPSSKANRSPANQKILPILSQASLSLSQQPGLVPILSQINPINNPNRFKIHVNIVLLFMSRST
jgi:hypothetical protein